jgi:hypothetical protein
MLYFGKIRDVCGDDTASMQAEGHPATIAGYSERWNPVAGHVGT